MYICQLYPKQYGYVYGNTKIYIKYGFISLLSIGNIFAYNLNMKVKVLGTQLFLTVICHLHGL